MCTTAVKKHFNLIIYFLLHLISEDDSTENCRNSVKKINIVFIKVHNNKNN